MTAAELVDSCLIELDRHLERVEAVRRRVDDSVWNRRTARGEWSAGEVVEHMVRTHQPYMERVGAAVAAAGPDGGAPVEHTWFGGLLIKASGPNGNAKSPGSTVPAERQYDEVDYRRWVDQAGAWRGIVESAKGKDLTVRIKNPFVGIISMNLADCLELVRDHTERHVRQIEERTARSSD
ncbi:MAG: hypothetical protein HONBIEJF_02387 [Fimbriimonadaceae bacterium]|nr:hypothetical protein [Fimbriimonadaceae bacterium]